MTYRTCLSIVLLFCLIGSSSAAEDLLQVVAQLNARLQFTTNVIYNPQQRELSHLQRLQPVGQLIISSLGEFGFNGTELKYFIEERVLFVLIVEDPFGPLELLQKLHLHFDEADFLLVIERLELDGIWLQFVYDAWQLGYIKLLFLHSTLLYENQLFPELKLKPTTVERYAVTRGRLLNLHGYETRVAVYSNPPRSLLYKDEWGNQVYGGYYMRFIRQFLRYMNATFVPIQTPSYSAGHCKQALQAGRVDLCADALAQETTKTFAVSRPIRLAYANIMVPSAKPLGSYRYLVAPFHSTVWICLIVYVGFIVCFMSWIHWQQQHRWLFSKFLLEAISSLLLAGFALKDLHGRERYILFLVLFMAGFVYSTFYLGYLKSILTTEVFEQQINCLEQLIEANITLMIDEYDRNLSHRYNLPDILWQIVKVVPDETLKKHRNSFDQEYAYMLFSDRMDLYDYAQKYLRHPRIRHIPINIFYLFAGFPMRETWFLKHHLSEAWANAFASGLVQKLALDADHETMTSSVGFLEFLITEYYEAQPLGLDYFVMPAMSLALGYGLAFLAFVIELTAWRTASAVPWR
ncbi:uncharacterized protein LOC133845047 [Drosophila sulfurigaster albostrigata]|uniref:uncharacterized protein LOC133845047 n=1 Tax=Drosophila sulfurigaster albostrigata TaxID=89887 RepID=UPI002D21A3FE|nr:uncharacterized protein LOC133845047 [Drosophila sulfurigaster albostrigata]